VSIVALVGIAAATSGLAILGASADPTSTPQTAATMLRSPQAAAVTARRLNGGAIGGRRALACEDRTARRCEHRRCHGDRAPEVALSLAGLSTDAARAAVVAGKTSLTTRRRRGDAR
jgi:hypothetical protein